MTIYSNNYDHLTGFHYGAINMHQITQAWCDSSEPNCYDNCDCGEYSCAACENGDYAYEGDGYIAVTCLDGVVLFCKSPFFTYAPDCSPCLPGAMDLDHAADTFTENMHDGVLHSCGNPCYCAGHDWFYDNPECNGVAPYPVFGVVSGRPCFPDSWYGNNCRPFDPREPMDLRWHAVAQQERDLVAAKWSLYLADMKDWNVAG